MRSFQQAHTESLRCLHCFEAPCVEACPTHINIPLFISMISSGNVRGAAAAVKSANALANICGSVCPEEVFCQSVCNRGKVDAPIEIRELHKYATQTEAKHGYIPTRQFSTDERPVAVVGGGPAGLGCAFELAQLGHPVTVFEGKIPGGVPSSSIPGFRLSREVVETDLGFLRERFSIQQKMIGNHELDRLRREFSAVFIAIGLGIDRAARVKGEQLRGVHHVLSYLESARIDQGKAPRGKKVIVVGGGNVSLDAATTAKKLGAGDVTLLYRRSEKELRVWNAELAQARAAGVRLRCLTLPIEIQGTTCVEGVLCRSTELSDRLDATGRPLPIEVVGTEHTLESDMVIVAIGQVLPDDAFPQIRRSAQGYLQVDGQFMTSLPGVFAGGDAIAGEGTIVQSVAQGKRAGRSIHEYVSALS